MTCRGRGLRKYAQDLDYDEKLQMIKSYKYRLYPSREQQQKLEETLTTCRFLYNEALAARIAAYKEEGKTLSYVQQAGILTQTKNEYQKRVHVNILQDTLRRLDKAYAAFFRRVKAAKEAAKKAGKKTGKKAGFPRFKPAQRYNSFTFVARGFNLLEDNRLRLSKLRLSKIGDVQIVLHRLPEGTVKTCTLLRDADQWFAILVCDAPPMQTACEFPDAVIGVDVGLKHFATLSTGETIANPRHYRASQKKLARLQKSLSRKKKGSKNRHKARTKVARCHRKIKNQRNDFLHKESAKLAKTYGTIVFEKLNIKGMVKNRRLAKSISDAGWSQFITYATYKAESAGGRVELVDARNTSQDCSACGAKVPKPLSQRTHSCPWCGLVLDRDLNASLNILNKSLSRRKPSCLSLEAM